MHTKTLGILFVFSLMFFSAACASAPDVFTGKLVQPGPPMGSGLIYNDAKIRVNFSVRKDGVGFTLQNKTPVTAVIKWNDTVYVSPEGMAYRTYNRNVRFADRNLPKLDGMIPPGSVLSDVIMPNDHLTTNAQPPDNILNRSHIGKEIGIFMPLEIRGERIEYYFKIQVELANAPLAVRSASSDIRVSTTRPSYHLLVLDRFNCLLDADISDLREATLMYKYKHGGNGYLVALYRSPINGPILPTLPFGSRVMVDISSMHPLALREYIATVAFKRFVTHNEIIKELQDVVSQIPLPPTLT